MIFYLLIFYKRIGLFQNQAMILFVVPPKFCISMVFSFNWDLGCVQTDATLLTKDSQHCWMLHVASVCTPCCMLLDVVSCCCAKFETGQTFQPTTPNSSFVRDRRRVAQQCWIRLHSSSNIVGATHAHYAWFTKTYGLYPSHDALQVPTLLGVVASVCTPLPTRTLLRPFARSLRTYLVTYFLRLSLCPVTLFFAVYLLFWCLYCNLVK